ncbi:glycosyltransferase family 2 protein [Vibrio vulnificus]
MNHIYISVVSHNHIETIKSTNALKELAASNNITVVVKENTPQDNSDYFESIGVTYLNNPDHYFLGFGDNNNYVYEYCEENLNIDGGDTFIVCNPDVFITLDEVLKLNNIITELGFNISTINLYRDYDLKVHDNSVRRFPSFISLCYSLIFRRNSTIYNKEEINDFLDVDWAAGSFLAFRSSHYKNLNGFDKRYFMYCEDIDICFRSSMIGHRVKYIPMIRATHLAQHENRNVLSKHFVWHVSSALKFLVRKFYYDIK